MLVYQADDGARIGLYLRPRTARLTQGEGHDGRLLAQYWAVRSALRPANLLALGAETPAPGWSASAANTTSASHRPHRKLTLAHSHAPEHWPAARVYVNNKALPPRRDLSKKHVASDKSVAAEVTDVSGPHNG